VKKEIATKESEANLLHQSVAALERQVDLLQRTVQDLQGKLAERGNHQLLWSIWSQPLLQMHNGLNRAIFRWIAPPLHSFRIFAANVQI
jgi:hypothetical protein